MKIIGQKRALNIISTAIKANPNRLKPVLLTGPRGHGKTTLAEYIANKIGGEFISVNAPAIDSLYKFAKLIMSPKDGDILFIDEIHALNTRFQELLYTVLQDNKLTIPEKLVSVDTPKFTFVGATTDEGKLLEPMHNRFVYKIELERYSDEELAEIVRDRFNGLDSISLEIAKAGRSCPRTTLSIATWCSDYFRARKERAAPERVADALKVIGVHPAGFTVADIKYLRYLAENKRAVGLKTIAKYLMSSVHNVENTIEPFLIQRGLVAKGSAGRYLTERGKQLLK